MAINLGVYQVKGANPYAEPKIKSSIKDYSNELLQQARQVAQAKRKQRQELDNFVLNRINDLPDQFEPEKLPAPMQAPVAQKLYDARQEYVVNSRNLKQIQAQYGPDSGAFLSAMDKMNNSKRVFENVNNSLIDLQDLTKEYVEDRQSISKGMEPADVAKLDEIFVNKNYSVEFDEQGNPFYQTQFGDIAHEDISKYYLKDSKFGLDMLKQAESLYTQGTKGGDITSNTASYNLLKATIENSIVEGGEQRIKSILNDELFDGFKLTGLDAEALLDGPDSEKAAEKITTAIMDHLTTVNQDGLKKYKQAQTAKLSRGSGFGQGLRDDLATTGYIFNEAIDFANNQKNYMPVEGASREDKTFSLVSQLKRAMPPKDRDKLMSRGEMYNLFLQSEELDDGDKSREAFKRLYGDSQIFFDSEGMPINTDNPQDLVNLYLDLADLSTDARNYYKNQIQASIRQQQATQKPTAQELIDKYNK